LLKEISNSVKNQLSGYDASQMILGLSLTALGLSALVFSVNPVQWSQLMKQEPRGSGIFVACTGLVLLVTLAPMAAQYSLTVGSFSCLLPSGPLCSNA
jgi:hypothetical protein